jgi:PXA domain/Sorting nexin C terminal/PX domain
LPSETTFPLACRQILTSFILSISNHLCRKRPADQFLDFLGNSTSIMIVFLSELSTALRAGQGQSPEDAIHQYLKDEPDSNLANVLSKQQQERKLGMVADDILANFLDSKAFNFPPSKTFLREIFAGVVLETTIKTCSKPEWINGWIVYLLEDGEPEIMNVIDAGVEGMGNPMQSTPKSLVQVDAEKRHARRISKAEEAMEEAMLEARRLSEMIAEEDARKKRDIPSVLENEDAASTATTEGIATPTSSDSDQNRIHERSLDSSMILERTTTDEVLAQNLSPPKPSTFTDFDKIAPSDTPTAPKASYSSHSTTESSLTTVLTLHNAAVTIIDDGDPSDKTTLRSKPTGEYLLQIEPAISRFPGWMIVRRYQDFETLHEVLRRISVISGVPQFVEKHAVLPTWKGQSKHYLRRNLERYLQHALNYEPLAESEAMKKFLEKETGLEKAPTPNKNMFLQGPAALETMGKGFVSVLGQAPKGLAGGGKAVLGGVQGVFGAVGGGLKKPAPGIARSDKSASVTSLQRPDSHGSRASQESIRMSSSPTEVKQQRPISSRQSTEFQMPSQSSPIRSQPSQSQESLHLPPPPSDISDDYGQLEKATPHARTPSVSRTGATDSQPPALSPTKPDSARPEPSRTNTGPSLKTSNKPVTEEETRVSIELIFAIITELYSLSSAWTIRLSLLSAAKTFLLRPNNPQLESIRLLLQDSIIDANFVSDTGLAGHILKLRENTLPTEEELKNWPPEMSDAEKEKLRAKARRLLVERGMPQALTSVMGSAASGEALGRVFDCLQVQEVARGLIFALLLQALRATTQ